MRETIAQDTAVTSCAHAVQLAYRAYAAQDVVRDAADFIEDVLKNTVVELRPGTVVTVSAVTNAGFNGMQVGGYDADGSYFVGCFR